MTIYPFNKCIPKFYIVRGATKVKDLKMEASIGVGLDSYHQSSDDIEHSVVNNTLYIYRIKKNQIRSLSSFLLTLELSQYNKIVFTQCDFDLDEENFFGLDVIANRYKKIMVFQLNKCTLSQKSTQIQFSAKNLIVEIVSDAETTFMFPENKIVQINNKHLQTEFYNDSMFLVSGADFSNQVQLDTFQKIIETCPNLIRHFLFADCIFSPKFEAMLKIIENKQPENLSLVFHNPKKFNEQMFANHSSLTVRVKEKTDDKLIKGSIKIKIPEILTDQIVILEKNYITVQNILLFKNNDFQTCQTFFTNCLLYFDCLIFSGCNINDKFLQFFDTCVEQKEKLNGKILKLMHNCKIDGDQSLSVKLIELIEKTKYSFVFQWGDMIYIDSTPLDNAVLKINQKNFHSIFNFLKKNKNLLNVNTLHFYGILFNEGNAALFKEVLESGNMQNLNLLKLRECELEVPFLRVIDYIKNNIELKNLYYIGIPKTEASLMVLEASRKLNNCNLMVSHYDPEFNVQQKKTQSGYRKMRCEFLQKLINEAGNDNEKVQFLSQISCYPGLPGQALAEMKRQPFFAQSKQTIRKNLEDIADSWIIGYKQEKQQVINSVMAFMENRDMKGQQYILLYGPPGTSKSTFAYMVAAMIRYSDTNDLEGSMYNPKKKETSIMPWLKVVQGAEITSKETLCGFERTYQKSQPGVILDGLRSNNEQVFNIVTLIDELDKIKSNNNLNVIDALTLLLEPTQRGMFEDKFLRIIFNCHKIFIVCTANDISSIPPHVKNRMCSIYIGPLPLELLYELSFKKWKHTQIAYDINDIDFSWDKQTFFWFVELFGPSGIRTMLSKFEILANKVIEQKDKKQKLVINKQLLTSLFPDVFDVQKYVENQPGYIIGTYVNTAGEYVCVWVIASPIGRDRGDHINFIPDAKQNRDNGVHGIKYSYQILIHAILTNLQQNSGVLDGYKIKLNQSFALSTTDTFNLDDMNYFAPQGVLSIISSVINRPIDHVLVIGFVDSNGHFAAPEGSNNITGRLSASLNTKNSQIRKIFLPKNLSIDAKEVCKKNIAYWCNTNKIPLKSVNVFFVDDMRDIVLNILKEEDGKPVSHIAD